VIILRISLQDLVNFAVNYIIFPSNYFDNVRFVIARARSARSNPSVEIASPPFASAQGGSQ